MSTDALTVVTGGGSGTGRDIALDQAALGREVLVVGRRREPLEVPSGLVKIVTTLTPWETSSR